MKEISTLKHLMEYYLVSLHASEASWAEALRDHTGYVNSPELKKIFIKDSRKALEHAEQLNSIITALGRTSLGAKDPVAGDFIRQIRELRDTAADPEVLDAGLAVIHQCMHHYLIAKHGTVASYARLLLEEKIAGMLHEMMEEEKTGDADLTRLAESKLNVKAKSALIH